MSAPVFNAYITYVYLAKKSTKIKVEGGIKYLSIDNALPPY